MLLYEDKKNSGISLGVRTVYGCLPHLHSHIEAGILLSGSTELTMDGKVFRVEAGDAFLIFPNRIHGYTDGADVLGFLLICDPADIAPFTDVFHRFLLSDPVLHPADGGRAIAEAFDKAVMMASSPEGTPYAIESAKAYASAAIAEMFACDPGLTPFVSSDPDAIQRILLYCDTHYTEELTLDILEKELGYSKYYISHVFTDSIKTGFSRYLRGLRISAAKRLIRHTNKSMTDIAYESGFATIRTFNRQFLSETGQTPTEYAALHRDEQGQLVWPEEMEN